MGITIENVGLGEGLELSSIAIIGKLTPPDFFETIKSVGSECHDLNRGCSITLLADLGLPLFVLDRAYGKLREVGALRDFVRFSSGSGVPNRAKKPRI